MEQEGRRAGGDASRPLHSYVKVYAFMGSALRLSGLELLVFARIFGFTVNGLPFYESRAKTAESFGSSRRAVIAAVGRLVERGLIKEVSQKHGVCVGKSKAYVADLTRVAEVAGADVDASLLPVDEIRSEESSPFDMHEGEETSPSNSEAASLGGVKNLHPIPKRKENWL